MAGFTRDHLRLPVQPSSRLISGVLTAMLCGLFMVLMLRLPEIVPANTKPVEIVTTLIPDAPIRKLAMTPPPFLAHLLRPHAEVPAAPSFTIATEAPPAPALLAATAAQTSPMAGGIGTGSATGTPSSANGANGNGTGISACYDAAWAKAVSDHIGQHMRYPERAKRDHITGVVFVHFIVHRNGLLDRLEIGKSSGDSILDNAAYDLVRRAQPLPRIPDRMHAERIDAELPIDYGIKGVIFHPSQGSCSG